MPREGTRRRRSDCGLAPIAAVVLVLFTRPAAADFAYVANLRAGTVSVIDLRQNVVAGRIPVGADPNGIAVTPDAATVYVTNFASNDLSLIDTATRQVVATIPVGQGPVGIAFSPDGTEAYVANKTDGSLSVLDTTLRAVVATIPLAPERGANGVAVTPDGSAIYVTNSRSSSVSIVDRLTRSAVAKVDVDNAPSRVVMDPVRSFAYVAAFNGYNVDVIDRSSRQLSGRGMLLASRPTGLAVSADGARLWVAQEDGVSSIALETFDSLPAVEGFFRVGSSRAPAVTAGGSRVYVTSLDEGTTSVIDTARNTVVETICGDAGPFAIAVADAPSGLHAWIEEPFAGAKIHSGTREPVRVIVQAGATPLASWTLTLVDPDGVERSLATGTTEVADQVVAEIAGRELVKQGVYSAVLDAVDGGGATARARVDVVVPDSHFALMPLDSSHMNAAAPRLDDAGRVLSYDSGEFSLSLLDLASGVVSQLNREGRAHLSGDASTLVEVRGDDALLFRDIATGTSVFGPFLTQPRTFTLSSSSDGFHLALTQRTPSDPDLLNSQVFYYDQLALEMRQLSNVPDELSGALKGFSGPVISGDAGSVVFGAKVPLADAPVDPNAFWRIYDYDTTARQLRYLAGLPKPEPFDSPSISADGHWLAFSTSRPGQPNFRIGALLDLASGALEAPLAALDGYETFDAVVTGDGRGIVVSTAADLDPAVGNADGNAELFLLDRESGTFEQLTETIGQSSFRSSPSVSADGGAAAFRMSEIASGACPAVGVQRDEATGFNFGRTYTVHRVPGDAPPQLDPVADARATVGQALQVGFHATDPESERLSFFLQPIGGLALPPGSSVSGGPDGDASFFWYVEDESSVGDHTFRLGVFDPHGGFDLRDFSVRVCVAFAQDGSCAAMPPPTPTPSSTAPPSPTATRTSTFPPTPSASATLTASPTRASTATATRSEATATSTSVAPASPTSGSGSSGGGCDAGGSSSPWPGLVLLAILASLSRRCTALRG